MGAAALLVTLAVGPSAGAQPTECPKPGLGPPAACVDRDDQGPATSLAPDDPADSDPGPALWIGAVFGVSGLVGMVFATARVRGRAAEDLR